MPLSWWAASSRPTLFANSAQFWHFKQWLTVSLTSKILVSFGSGRHNSLYGLISDASGEGLLSKHEWGSVTQAFHYHPSTSIS